jgi:hypothetical protein
LVSIQEHGLGASACKTLHTSTALESSEGEKPDMKISIEYLENGAKFHLFGEDHRNFENFLQPFGITHFSFPFVI